MLSTLTINNIALVENLSISFASGLNVLSGETGAGKSIILGALGFALGEKPDAYLLRSGAKQGQVVAEFEFASQPEDLAELLEQYAIPQESTLIFRRLLYPGVKHKAFINDIPVGVTALKDLARLVLEYHGQHENRLLVDQAEHRRMLDQFSGLAETVQELAQLHADWQLSNKEYASVKLKLETANNERDYLAHAHAELSRFAPQKDEEAALVAERQQLMQAEKLSKSFEQTIQLLAQNKVENVFNQIHKSLSKTEIPKLIELAERCERLAIEAADISAEITSYSQQGFAGNYRLQHVEDRLFALRDLARKYHKTANDLPDYIDSLANYLQLMHDGESSLQTLAASVAANKDAYLHAAYAISAKRMQDSSLLQERIMQELHPLKMDKVEFVVAVNPTEQMLAHGVDQVQFLLRTNASSPLSPLGALASGGEVSRLMLAIKCALALETSTPTLIFDEVDTGIGGATAAAVGKRLSYLGKHCQVHARVRGVLLVLHCADGDVGPRHGMDRHAVCGTQRMRRDQQIWTGRTVIVSSLRRSGD